jgi:hypothetical protein
MQWCQGFVFLAKLIAGHPVWMVTPRLTTMDNLWFTALRDIVAATKALFSDHLRAFTPSIQ